jgi:hypothetical protein
MITQDTNGKGEYYHTARRQAITLNEKENDIQQDDDIDERQLLLQQFFLASYRFF